MNRKIQATINESSHLCGMNSASNEGMWGQKGKRELANENEHYEN